MTLAVLPPLCKRKGCNGVLNSRGLCKTHYDEVWRQERKAGAGGEVEGVEG